MKTSKAQEILAFISRLSGKDKIIFYTVSCVLFFILLYASIIAPLFYKLHSLDEEAGKKEAAIKKDLQILAQKDSMLAESTKYNSFLTPALNSEDEEITFLLREIESIADKSSVYLIDMKPADLKSMGSSDKYLVNLNCEGQMEQIIAFMYGIESSNKLLTIEKYQISPKSNESSVAKCTMTISKIVLK